MSSSTSAPLHISQLLGTIRLHLVLSLWSLYRLSYLLFRERSDDYLFFPGRQLKAWNRLEQSFLFTDLFYVRNFPTLQGMAMAVLYYPPHTSSYGLSHNSFHTIFSISFICIFVSLRIPISYLKLLKPRFDHFSVMAALLSLSSGFWNGSGHPPFLPYYLCSLRVFADTYCSTAIFG